VRRIADSGLIIAALDERDAWHSWARGVLLREEPPWLVCEPVLTEISASIGSAIPVLEMLAAGDLEVAFGIEENKQALLKLVRKYRDQGMDLADAAVVRMSELYRESIVYTVDKKDFLVYRRHGNRVIECVFPD
jgi:predicted nucleic acid-binding protein